MTYMTQHNGRPPQPSLGELRDDIARRRADLADTVEALAAKADVRARARRRMGIAKDRVRDQVEAVQAIAVDGVLVARDRTRETIDFRNRTAWMRDSLRTRPAVWITSSTGVVVLAVALVALARRAARR